jgi:hypothetical protein
MGQRGGGRHLADLGWRMKRPPAPPSGLAWRIIGTGHRDPRWRPYLEPYGSREEVSHAAPDGPPWEAPTELSA